MGRRWSIGLIVVLLSLAAWAPAAKSQTGAPLPPMPDPAVLDQVLADSKGAEIVPLRAPNYITRDLGQFSGPFRGVPGLFDVGRTVTYFDLDGVLRESVMPLKESRTSQLAPSLAVPPDGAPGQVIAATYDAAHGVRIAVAIFGPGGELPVIVRFYQPGGVFEDVEATVSEFEDPDGDGQVAELEAGAVIAFDRTCVTIGLHQICWAPPGEDVRDPATVEQVEMAEERLRAVYDFDATFLTEQAMPDIIGREVRGECARSLSGAKPFEDVRACVPNLGFASSEEALPGEPIALFTVPQPADIRTYSALDGSFLGGLPAGDYLVLDPMPDAQEPGDPALLFLVSGDGVNQYLIPATVMQGFGADEDLDPRQAAIKDGYASYRGWGS